MRLTRHVQSSLLSRWGGYAPPSSCTLVPLPSDVSGPGNNPWSARTLAVVPTMPIPEEVAWNKELVYNCMWSLLSEIAVWNRDKAEEVRIKRVLMTGLATGVGKVASEICARQMVLAVKHKAQPLPSEPDWVDVMPRAMEVKHTYSNRPT